MGSSFLDMTKVSHAQTDAEWLAKDGDSGALVLVGGWESGSGASGSKIWWLTVRLMQEVLPLYVNAVTESRGSSGDLWVSLAPLTDFCY